MKFSSIFKLSIHNMMQNKLRTILTIIVLFVMAVVIMLIASFGFSFYTSSNSNIQKQFQENGTKFVITNVYKMDSLYKPVEVTQGDVANVLSKIDGDDTMFTNIYMTGTANNLVMSTNTQSSMSVNNVVPYYAKSNMFFGEENYLSAGRMWTSSDDASSNIWLSTYYENFYNVGDSVYLSHNALTPYKIAGFINYAQWAGKDSGTVFLDYHNFTGKNAQSNEDLSPDINVTNLYIDSIIAELKTQPNIIYGMKTQNRLQKLADSIDVKSDIKNNQAGLSVSCDILDMLRTSQNILFGVLAGVSFLGIIIIFLSIGSVANTIKITVEQNRKFFGVMKAVGMKDRQIKRIVRCQSIIMILIAVLIAAILVMFLIKLLLPILTDLIVMMYGSTAIAVASMNVLIPIITFVVLVLSVLVFTRTSLRDISKMDVISVISEVS